jgi:protease IV
MKMDQPPEPTEWSQPPIYPEVVPEPAPTPPRRKSRALVRLLSALLLFGLVGSLALNALLMAMVGLSGFSSSAGEPRVQERFVSHNRHARNKVAILSIEGTIFTGEGFFKQQLDHARKDAEDGTLKAIVVRVNSPGGTITGSDYMFHYLRQLADNTHLPIVVSMGGVAASGGYFVSMCVGDEPDSIFAEPTTWTGSIGVIIPHYNIVDLMEKWGIQEDAIASHHLKGMGSIARKMTEEERKILQALVDEGFTQFKNVIKKGRPKFRKDPAALDKLATGQIFTAQQALENGLIDKIGFIEDAVDRAIHLAGLDVENVSVVKYKEAPGLSDILFGQGRAQPSIDLAALLESTTPRAFYLCTWLPAVAGSAK